MKKTIKQVAFTLFLGGSLLMNGCSPETKDALKNIFDDSGRGFGWLQAEEKPEQLESDLNLGSSSDVSLPSKVDLTDKFPPIGDQGQYGTCVAWATGYNLKTYLEACDHNYSASQLAQPAYQFSPKDLFWSIANSQKGDACNGTNFEYALDQMVSRGIAPMSTVPYVDMGDCSSSPNSAWTTEANKFKLENYRKIDLKVEDFKGYLAKGRPIVLGAKLGVNFMSWNNSNVITSDEAGYNGQHAYHAMIISGYDDSKGPRGAFRVVNSWTTGWGDGGYIWVDYNFMVNDFAFVAFVAQNKRSDNYNPDPDGDNNVDPNEVKDNSTDLVAWKMTDQDNPDSEDQTKRSISYNVYNVGDQTIPASKDWNICYAYYNAYNADDWGILLYDYYTDDFGDAVNNNGELTSGGPGISGNWWNHIDVPGGKSVAEVLYGEGDFKWGYTMPSTLSGSYYLVLVADGYDDIAEADETNNFFYVTTPNGDPITVTNGVMELDFVGKNAPELGFDPGSRPGKYAKSPASTAINKRHVNAYSTKEIRQMIAYHKKSGLLRQKINAFKAGQAKKTGGN